MPNLQNLINLAEKSALARLRICGRPFDNIQYQTAVRDNLSFILLGIGLALETYREYLPNAKTVSPLYDAINAQREELISAANEQRTIPKILSKS